MPRGRPPQPVEERFNKYVDKKGPDDCWGWTGAKDNKGYGRTRDKYTKQTQAHRLALELHLGRPITEGLNVLHSCDNPSCVNHNHLREGTHQDNVDDMHSRNRHVGNRKLTVEQVADIRSRVGQTGKAIAAEFGVDSTTVYLILKRKTWAD